MQAGDTAKARKVLITWQLKEPDNPNWYVARFNYQLRMAYRVIVNKTSTTSRGVELQKNGKDAGSINEGYEPQLLEAARATLREGIRLAPERLDMRFGLAKTYEMTHDAAREIEVLTSALADRKASGKPWRWIDAKPLPKPEAVFLPENLEEYMLPYWQANTPEDTEAAGQLAELLSRYYPESALGYFNRAVYHGIKREDDKAYGLYKQANSRRPNDWQTLANLTQLAINLGKKAEAQEYLTTLRKLPEGRMAATQLNKDLRAMK